MGFDRFMKSTLMVKISLGASIAAFIFILIGMAAPYWTAASGSFSLFGIPYSLEMNLGLWRLCSGGHCTNISETPSWFEATQAFVVLGWIASLVGLVGVILYIFIEKLNDPRVYFASLIGHGLSFFFIFIAVCVYGSETPDNLGWAFAISVVGMVAALAAAILMATNKIRGGEAS